MDYTIEDVRRDLRRLKVNDLTPETEERLMEMFRRWKRGEPLRAERPSAPRTQTPAPDTGQP